MSTLFQFKKPKKRDIKFIRLYKIYAQIKGIKKVCLCAFDIIQEAYTKVLIQRYLNSTLEVLNH